MTPKGGDSGLVSSENKSVSTQRQATTSEKLKSPIADKSTPSKNSELKRAKPLFKVIRGKDIKEAADVKSSDSGDNKHRIKHQDLFVCEKVAHVLLDCVDVI